MPELPEVSAIAEYVDGRAAGLPVRRVDVASLSVLKTADPPVSTLVGRTIERVRRVGKYLVFDIAAGPGVGSEPLHLVVHLSRAGWLRWSDALAVAPPRPGGKGPIALRVHCGIPDEGFDITEAGTQKRVAVWLVRDLDDIERVAMLGPDALDITADEFVALCTAHRCRLKTLLTDQRVLAGVGNAYSDEILFAARLSPFAIAATLGEERARELHAAMRSELLAATDRMLGQQAARLKAEKHSALRVHARTGQPCGVCGTTIAQVAYTDRSFQYCPGCQTGGRVLADRRLSRLLK